MKNQLFFHAFTEDTDVDWYRDYRVNALNLNSLIYENSSSICGDDNLIYAIFGSYFQCCSESEIDEAFVSKEIDKIKMNGGKIEYALYSKDCHYLCGFVYSE